MATKKTAKECAVPACENMKTIGRGLCGKHDGWLKSPDENKRRIAENHQVIRRPALIKDAEGNRKASPKARRKPAADVRPPEREREREKEREKGFNEPEPHTEETPLEEKNRAMADLAIACCSELAARAGVRHTAFRGGQLFELPTDEEPDAMVWLSPEGEFRSVSITIGTCL